MRSRNQWNLGVGVLGLLACALLNAWAFRYGILYGLVGLNLTKHVGVAVLCQAVGANPSPPRPARHRTSRHGGHPLLVGPHARPRGE